jgi:L-threonylcarbamoyladenylate synthase
MKKDWQEATKILKKGGVGVLPTDTIYGLVGSALSRDAVEKIYKAKNRPQDKALIILITSYKDLDVFGVEYNKKELEKVWPGKVSVIVPCKTSAVKKEFRYLHRGTNTLAFRMIGPKNRSLFNLVRKVGPIVAPSANLSYQDPAQNITQARKYFGDTVDFYVSAGTKKSKPSTLVSYKNGEFTILRQGAVVIK